MASHDDYDELEKIVREQMPGFTVDRRTRRGRSRVDKHVPSEGTPDVEDLRAKAEEILEGKKRTRRGSPSRKASPNASRAAASDNVTIVDVRPDHIVDKADRPSRPKKVIISRSTGRIIAEQG